MNATTPPNRVFGLDVMRAVAIILVVLGHGMLLLQGTRFENFPYIRMIDGVDLFFVLSGFLIGSILLKDLHATEKFGVKQTVHFWKRRWLRTLPNYYLILLVNYLIVSYGVIHEDINQFNWKFTVFMQNFDGPFYGFFWESWSLAVEEWFYLIAPLILMLLLTFIKPKAAYFWLCMVMIVVPVVFRAWAYTPYIDDFWFDVTFRKVVLTRLDSIAYGLFAAWVYWYYPNAFNRFKIALFVMGLALIAFIMNYKLPCTTYYRQILFFSLSPLACMLLLPLANSIKSVKGFGAKAITHISKISYSMYLLNLAVVAEVIRDNFTPSGNADAVFKYILYWIIVIVASTFLYRFFEKPIMNLRDRM